MAPPKFADLGKAATDLFTEDFGGSSNSLTLKSKAANGTTLKVEGVRDHNSGAVAALLETKFTHAATGLTVKEKWTTKNVVTTEVTSENKLVQGLSSTIMANFAPSAGSISGLKIKTGFVHNTVSTNIDVTPKDVAASGVFAFQKWLVGAGTTYNLGTGGLQGTKVTVGYVESDLAVHASVTDSGNVSANIYHTPRSDIKAGVELGWEKNSNKTTFGVAGQYALDNSAFVKAKVDSALNIGLSYVQKLRPGVTLRLSADVSGAQLSSDAHQLGLHLTLES